MPIKAETAMLIRRPVKEVFNAFIDPEITSQFWFSRGSGKLAVGKRIRWFWDMYNFSIDVVTKKIEKNKRIVIEWPGESGPSIVEWTFASLKNGTFVTIQNTGFKGPKNKIVLEALNSTEGFTFVLSGLKAFLEHKLRLNLVPDRFPQGLPK